MKNNNLWVFSYQQCLCYIQPNQKCKPLCFGQCGATLLFVRVQERARARAYVCVCKFVCVIGEVAIENLARGYPKYRYTQFCSFVKSPINLPIYSFFFLIYPKNQHNIALEFERTFAYCLFVCLFSFCFNCFATKFTCVF